MDPVNLLYYGVICGTLALVAPGFRSRAARVASGIAVGLVAAALLPALKGWVAG